MIKQADFSQTQLKEAIEKSRLNLIAYRRINLNIGPDEVDPPSFHYDWSDDLLNSEENCAYEGFRESAKTQLVLRAFLLYCFTFPKATRDYIVLIKKNATLAVNKLKEIKEEYKSNPIISANLKEIKEDSGQVFSVDVYGENEEVFNIRLEAYGKGSSIRGLANIDRRPRVVVIDDPQDIEDARSETVSEHDWDWFLSDVCFLGQNSRIFLIGNNLGEQCIIERLFENNGKLEKIKFKTKRIGILNDSGESVWPEKYKIEDIKKEKADYDVLGKLDIWLRERMCQATNEETRVFNDEDYRYYTASRTIEIIKKCNLFATLDPASSTSNSACFRALVINAVDEDNNWFIPVVYYGRWDSYGLMNILFEARAEWGEYGLRDFGIEKGQYKQVIEPFLMKEMKQRNVFFNVVPIEHAKVGSKLERIKMLQPRFKAHGIWFPDDSPDWVVEMKAQLKGITRTEIKSLFVDLPDSLAMQEQIAKKPIRMTKSSAMVQQAEIEYNVLDY